jgi:hypothetical protein
MTLGLLHQRRAQSLPRGADARISRLHKQRPRESVRIDETTAATLRFGNDRVATFITTTVRIGNGLFRSGFSFTG